MTTTAAWTKTALTVFALFFSVSCQSKPAATEVAAPADTKYQTWVESVRYYKKHFGLNDEFSKKVNNRGNGYEPLYGVRNFRAVLHGVYYRGGANNSFNKNLKRSNENPLQEGALQNLCKENFGSAFYFYPTNADQMQKNTICETTEGKSKNSLNYQQVSALKPDNQVELLRRIHQHIVNMETKPIYGHCWNGWHASGVVAALSLIQFCHYSNEEALAYWRKNTDGNDQKYFAIKKRISTFKRIPELEVEDRFRLEMCPNQKTAAR